MVFVSWTSGGDRGRFAVYSKAFRLASVKTLISLVREKSMVCDWKKTPYF